MRLILAEAENYAVTKDCLQDTRFLPGQINIGLVWGYATDGSRWPEWILTPTMDGWNLTHAASKNVFNPALRSNMEIWALPRYFFYDAWREIPTCNKPEELLYFRKGRTPIPRGLQAGVNMPTVQAESKSNRIQSATVDSAPAQNDQESAKPCGNGDADQAAPSTETEWKAAEEAVAAHALAAYKAKLGRAEGLRQSLPRREKQDAGPIQCQRASTSDGGAIDILPEPSALARKLLQEVAITKVANNMARPETAPSVKLEIRLPHINVQGTPEEVRPFWVASDPAAMIDNTFNNHDYRRQLSTFQIEPEIYRVLREFRSTRNPFTPQAVRNHARKEQAGQSATSIRASSAHGTERSPERLKVEYEKRKSGGQLFFISSDLSQTTKV
eukprot:s436_g15.t1